MIQAIILGILGLVFFFIGVFELNSVVQKILNFRIRQYLQSVNKNRFFGAIFGFILTALLQSSSVASVLIIALVNAGLLNFLGSLPIILGIGVGSTIAPALVAFKITNIAPIFIIIGGFLYLFSKKDKLQSLGQAFLYFGLLFFGLDLIGEAAEPIKNSVFFIRLAQEGMSPFFGLLFGIIFTAIIQSSVVPIGLLVILAGEGLVGLNLALPIILGANIGTTFTAILVSLKENLAAKRTALFYLIFKIIGVIIFFSFLGPFTSFLEKIFPSLPFQIIGAHFFFNLFLFLIFIFLTEAIGKIIKRILPGEEKVLPLFPIYLDKRLTGYPSQSFSVVLKELSRAVILIKEMFEETENLFIDFKPSAFKRIDYIEVVIDELQDEILDFLDCLKKEKLTQKDVKKAICLATITDELERIGDRTLNVAKLARLKAKKEIVFSQEAEEEIKGISSMLKNSFSILEKAISSLSPNYLNDILAQKKDFEEKISSALNNHLKKFYERECPMADSTIFNNILINFREIHNHCLKIIQTLTMI